MLCSFEEYQFLIPITFHRVPHTHVFEDRDVVNNEKLILFEDTPRHSSTLSFPPFLTWTAEKIN